MKKNNESSFLDHMRSAKKEERDLLAYISTRVISEIGECRINEGCSPVSIEINAEFRDEDGIVRKTGIVSRAL